MYHSTSVIKISFKFKEVPKCTDGIGDFMKYIHISAIHFIVLKDYCLPRVQCQWVGVVIKHDTDAVIKHDTDAVIKCLVTIVIPIHYAARPHERILMCTLITKCITALVKHNQFIGTTVPRLCP